VSYCALIIFLRGFSEFFFQFRVAGANDLAGRTAMWSAAGEFDSQIRDVPIFWYMKKKEFTRNIGREILSFRQNFSFFINGCKQCCRAGAVSICHESLSRIRCQHKVTM
jgi:hypothetical protein